MSKNGKVKKMVFVNFLLPFGYYVRKGALKSFNMIEGGGGYLKTWVLLSRGLEIIAVWDKKQFLLNPPPPNLNYDWSLILVLLGKV